MAKREIIQKLKKMMPAGGKKGDILEVSVESPEHEAMEHAPGGPEEGMEDQELSIELMGKGKGKYQPSGQEPEEGESEEHEAAESEEFEAGEAEESEEAEPIDLSSISDEELQAELDSRKKAAQEAQAKRPMAGAMAKGTPGPKGGY